MEEQKDSPVLIQYIRDRVEKRNKNFVMLFVGPTGSGKSYAALKLAESLDPTFDITRVNFRARDFMNTINQLVESSEQGEKIVGKVILWDEFGVEHNAREFMTVANRVVNYFFQTSRHLNLIVIMTVPLLSFIDSSTRRLMHAIAEMGGINQHKKTASVKIKMNQVNVLTGKEYPKYLRYKKNNKTFVSKKMNFSLPSKGLLEEYEIKKKQFTTELNKEIMNRLLGEDEKNKQLRKPMTQNQEAVAVLLTKHGPEKVASILDVATNSVYGHKSAMMKKGWVFKPIREDNKVIRYEIEGFDPDSVKPPKRRIEDKD